MALTKREAAIISAYTGYLMCNFGDMAEYVEEKMGRGVWSHEYASESFSEQLRELVKPDFLAICVE